MAIFHHYAFADTGPTPALIADDLWAFCRTALGAGPDRTPGCRRSSTLNEQGADRLWGEAKCEGTHDEACAVGLCLAVAAVFATVGLPTSSGASVRAADEGVTGKTITLGFIYPATGVAASISQNGLKAFQARIDRQNAEGGVNGRKIKVISRDDVSSGPNLTAAQDLVENQHVFAVVNESPFAFLSYRWLLDHDVPMIGERYRRHLLPAEGQRGHPVVDREQQPLR